MSFLKQMKTFFSKKAGQESDSSSEVTNPQFNQNPSELEIIPDGEYVYFDDEDESSLVKNYKDGKLNGPSYFHYVSGELWIEENYQDGLIHGTTKYYEKDGSLKKIEIWEKGKFLESPTLTGRKEEKVSFEHDDFDKKMLFEEYIDGVECFGYYFHQKKYDEYEYAFDVNEIYLSEEFRIEISLKLQPHEFVEKEIDLEQFKRYLFLNIEKGQYDFGEPRKILEKYTCRYQSKVDESGKFVPKYSEDELLKIEQEEYLTPIEWTTRFCNWKEIKKRKFKVQTYDY